MKQITNSIWLGNYQDLIRVAKLSGWVVIYVGSDSLIDIKEDKETHSLIIVNNLVDNCVNQKELITKVVNKIDSFVNHGLSMILVCCDAGLSRSPYVVARYISEQLNCNVDVAYKMLKAVYPEADESTPLRINDEKVVE